jgi:hypothetical protein
MTETTETTNTLRHSIVARKGGRLFDIRITLDDDCKNGHEDFSVTANIKEKDGRGRWVDAGGGCCHEEILSVRPELKPFVDLHLCDWEGVPMHGGNAWYWLAGYLGAPWVEYHGGSGSWAKSKEECLRIFKESLRLTDAELPAFIECRSDEEIQILLEDTGIVERWKQEADAAIAQLEAWTGKKFESKATRKHYKPVSKEMRELVAERRRTGYYSPESIAARDAEKKARFKAQKRLEILCDFDNKSKKLRIDRDIELFMLDKFGSGINYIYYNHTNEVTVNWTSTDRRITKEQFDAMAPIVAEFQTADLPEGVKFVWQEKSKY